MEEQESGVEGGSGGAAVTVALLVAILFGLWMGSFWAGAFMFFVLALFYREEER